MACSRSPIDSKYSDEDEVGSSTPIELLSEFLTALMSRNYELALDHCKTILSYEPENKTAVEFYPLIQARLLEKSDEDLLCSSGDEWVCSSSSSSNSSSLSLNYECGGSGSDCDSWRCSTCSSDDESPTVAVSEIASSFDNFESCDDKVDSSDDKCESDNKVDSSDDKAESIKLKADDESSKISI